MVVQETPVRPNESARPRAAEVAESRLCGSGYPTLRNVRCEHEGSTLTLRGCLPTYYLKQVALAAVIGVESVERIVDEIEVRAPIALDDRD